MINLDTGNINNFLREEELAGIMSKALSGLGSLNRREGAGSDMLGWIDLPRTPQRELEAINDAAKRIQDENDCLVVVGIGGSYLGARAAIEALRRDAPFPVLFAGNNISPEYHDHLLAALENKRFALCVISKSGTTTEPAIAFRILRKRLIEQFGREALAKRVFAVTDPAGGALRAMAETMRFTSFAIPPDVGGRYSVLSPVGLLPIAVSGINIMEMMTGASSALNLYTREKSGNTALRYAARRILLHEKGIQIEVLSTFHPELAFLCEWWKQLTGESEGKAGKGLFPASTVMTTDLHSIGQYLQEGNSRLLETFLTALQPRSDLVVSPDEEDLDGLNFLAGKNLGEINQKAFQGTFEAHAAGGRPVMAIEMPSVTAGSIGHLFIFFEVAVAVSGRLLGINPFDQPGVEEYKTRMFRLLGKPGVS
ncbi:MAG TPA: glucose-6-phosphate isomerase [Patescibacteria group bacterium]|nr:glucose-6-phosphate isomerase [Patescibacteria group bacterium]